MFVTVTNDFLGKVPSFLSVVWKGSRLGFKRVTASGFYATSLRLKIYLFFRPCVRLKLIPFTVMPPWSIRGFEKEISVCLVLAVNGFCCYCGTEEEGKGDCEGRFVFGVSSDASGSLSV